MEVFTAVSNHAFIMLFAAMVISWTIYGAWYNLIRFIYKKQNRYFDFDDHIGLMIALVVLVLGTIVIIGFILGMLGEIKSFEKNEPIYYEMINTQHDTLLAIINNSYDLVNTDIYSQIVEYNVAVTQIQNSYRNPNYSLMFKHSQCAWLDIPLINIDENGAH